MHLDFKLKGHEKAVESLSVSQDNSSLASGAEDGHLIIHDIELRSICHSIHLPSLLPASSLLPSSAEERDLTVASIVWSSPQLIWASCSSAAMLIDLRTPSAAAAAQTFNVSDDIGSIALHEKGTHLAIGDDSGTVSLVDLNMSRPIKAMKPTHSSLVSSVSFRRFRPWDLISCSLDHTVVRWDFSKGKSLREWKLGSPQEEGAARLFNPPMVHGISLADRVTDERPYASLAAAAVGDGSIALFDLDAEDKGSKAPSSSKHKAKAMMMQETDPDLPKMVSGLRVDLGVEVGGHSAPASCVTFLSSQSLSIDHHPTDPNPPEGSRDLPLIASGGDDRRILIWSISRSLLYSWRKSKGVDGEEVGEALHRPLVDFKHKRKINCLANGSDVLFMADTGKFISGFKI